MIPRSLYPRGIFAFLLLLFFYFCVYCVFHMIGALTNSMFWPLVGLVAVGITVMATLHKAIIMVPSKKVYVMGDSLFLAATETVGDDRILLTSGINIVLPSANRMEVLDLSSDISVSSDVTLEVRSTHGGTGGDGQAVGANKALLQTTVGCMVEHDLDPANGHAQLDRYYRLGKSEADREKIIGAVFKGVCQRLLNQFLAHPEAFGADPIYFDGAETILNNQGAIVRIMNTWLKNFSVAEEESYGVRMTAFTMGDLDYPKDMELARQQAAIRDMKMAGMLETAKLIIAAGGDPQFALASSMQLAGDSPDFYNMHHVTVQGLSNLTHFHAAMPGAAPQGAGGGKGGKGKGKGKSK